MENPFTIIELRLSRIENILHQLLEHEEPQEKKEENSDIGGVELAMQITGKAKQTLYQLVSKRKIPHFRISGKLYFSRKNLLNWIKSGEVLTIEQLQKSADQNLNKS